MLAALYCTVLGLFCFVLALSVEPARRVRCMVPLVLSCVAGIQVLGMVNVLVLVLPGAEYDAQNLLRRSIRVLTQDGPLPAFGIGEAAYIHYLYMFGALTNDHPLVLHYSSIIPASVSVGLIARTCAYLDVNRFTLCLVTLLVCLSPSFLLYSSITLREPIELLSLLSYLACVVHRPGVLRALGASPLLVPGMLVHPVLFVYAFILVAVTCSLTAVLDRTHDKPLRLYIVSTLGIIAASASALVFVRLWYGETVLDIFRGGLFAAIVEYRQPIIEAKPDTAFGVELVFGSTGTALWSLAKNYVYYLFGPFLDFRFNINYLVMAWDSIVRLAGLTAIGVLLVTRRATLPVLVLLGFYITMTITWSIGTTNSGQAFRHHMLTQWVMFIFIGIAVREFVERTIHTART